MARIGVARTAMEQDGDLLFVYGTLKRGLANHHHLAGAGFVGVASLTGVALHDLGPFPMAVAGAGTAHGELYRVDGALLARLDRFEGVPRLYQRQRLPLADGRPVWIYLGRPRQVRHSPRLEGGHWPLREGNGVPAPMPLAAARLPDGARAALSALLAALVGLAPAGARADASLALCRHWQRSSGEERIRLGNGIGAASYLTKVRRLAESDPQHPELLYAPADLQRACDGWR